MVSDLSYSRKKSSRCLPNQSGVLCLVRTETLSDIKNRPNLKLLSSEQLTHPSRRARFHIFVEFWASKLDSIVDPGQDTGLRERRKGMKWQRVTATTKGTSVTVHVTICFDHRKTWTGNKITGFSALAQNDSTVSSKVAVRWGEVLLYRPAAPQLRCRVDQ